MTDDKLGFLDEQPRDEQGKFASKSEPAPATAPPPEPMTPEPQAPAPTDQPQAAPTDAGPQPEPWKEAKWWDEKEKRQQRERELEEARREAADLKRQLEDFNRKPQEPIDPILDPEGWERSISQRIEQAKWDTKTEVSLAFATQRHGAEAVKAAESWIAQKLAQNPAFWGEIKRQADPYDFVIRAHKREQQYSKLGDDEPEKWAEKWARENGYVKPGEATPQPTASGSIPQPGTPPPRPSLAGAPSAGGTAPKGPTGPGVSFEGVFK